MRAKGKAQSHSNDSTRVGCSCTCLQSVNTEALYDAVSAAAANMQACLVAFPTHSCSAPRHMHMIVAAAVLTPDRVSTLH